MSILDLPIWLDEWGERPSHQSYRTVGGELLPGGMRPPPAMIPTIPPGPQMPNYQPAPFAFRRAEPFINPLAMPGGGTSVGDLSISTGDIIKTAGGACSLLSGRARQICEGAVDVVDDLFGDQRGTSYAPTGGGLAPGCPPGWQTLPNGDCKKGGFEGEVERGLPFGETGYGWSAVLGIYGAGVTPIAVQSRTRRCPKAHVLGNDGVCYRRGSQGATKTFRAWNPGTKPLLTGGDVAALNRARRLQKSVGRLNTKFGPRKKNCACKTGRKKA